MKKFSALLCGAVLAISATASATVPDSEIGLGSAQPGMSTDKLIEVYGQPLQKHGDNWIYEHFTVEIDDDSPNVVEKVVTYSNQIGTPSDVKVGQDTSVLISAFGNPDEVDEDKEDNEVEYKYFNSNRTMKMEFKIVNNAITKIICKLK